MLIISNAMGKSASSVMFWYTVQLLQAARPDTNPRAVSELTQRGELPGIDGFVYPLDDKTVRRLLQLVEASGPVVVKTHYSLTPLLESLLRENVVKATFCFRDPRDMILSAIDHYRQTKAAGKPQFNQFTSVIDSLDVAAKWWCHLSCEWVESGLACLLRYEDIVIDPLNQVMRVRDHLGLTVDDAVIHAMLAREQFIRKVGINCFNRGELIRYPKEMSLSELKACNQVLGDYIARLGYPVQIGPANKQVA